jgi:PAS domain S-box-containing protein
MEKVFSKKKFSETGLKPIIAYALTCFFVLFFTGGLFFYQYQTQTRIINEIRRQNFSSSAVEKNNYISDLSNESRLLMIIGGIALIIFLFLIGLNIFFVLKFFLKPARQLQAGIEEILKGNYSRKLKVDVNNEFGFFADFFNQMYSRFEKANKNLEDSIQQRTGDLDKVIAKLWNKNLEMKDSEAAMINLLEDSRLLEGQLKQERDQMNAIITSMDEGLIVADINGKITFVNPASERMLEIKNEDVVGKDLESITPIFVGRDCEKRVSKEDRPLLKAINTGKPGITTLSDDYYYISKTGRRIAVVLASSPLFKEDKIVGGIATFRDVNIEKRLDEAKNGFISIASHQMRTPLTSMRWFSEMLISGDAGAINKEQKKFMETIHDGIERLIALLNLLLQIARVEAGRVKIAPVKITFKNIIDGVAVALGPAIKAKSLKIKMVFKPEHFPIISIDQEVVWQVFLNLISNACRYAPEKGVVTIKGEEKGDFVEFSVADKGIGIPKDAQERVFNKFFRAENAIKLVPEGSGLGLSLVKSLVDGWGGKIWFKSKIGQGTTMHFTIPLSGMEEKEGDVSLKV